MNFLSLLFCLTKKVTKKSRRHDRCRTGNTASHAFMAYARYKFETVMGMFFLSCLMSLALQGQSANEVEIAKEKFKKVNEKYSSTMNYSMNVTYKMFAKYTASQPEYTYSGFYKKHENNYHSSLLGIETIQNNEYKIVIDTSEKIIVVTDPEKSVQASSIDLEKSLSLCSSIKYAVSKDKEQEFTLNFDKVEGMEYSSIQINVNKDNYIKKLVFYFKTEVPLDEEDEKSPKEKPKIEIVYSDFKMQNSISKEELSEKKIFALKNGKLISSKQFANYRLINQKSHKQ